MEVNLPSLRKDTEEQSAEAGYTEKEIAILAEQLSLDHIEVERRSSWSNGPGRMKQTLRTMDECVAPRMDSIADRASSVLEMIMSGLTSSGETSTTVSVADETDISYTVDECLDTEDLNSSSVKDTFQYHEPTDLVEKYVPSLQVRDILQSHLTLVNVPLDHHTRLSSHPNKFLRFQSEPALIIDAVSVGDDQSEEDRSTFLLSTSNTGSRPSNAICLSAMTQYHTNDQGSKTFSSKELSNTSHHVPALSFLQKHKLSELEEVDVSELSCTTAEFEPKKQDNMKYSTIDEGLQVCQTRQRQDCRSRVVLKEASSSLQGSHKSSYSQSCMEPNVEDVSILEALDISKDSKPIQKDMRPSFPHEENPEHKIGLQRDQREPKIISSAVPVCQAEVFSTMLTKELIPQEEHAQPTNVVAFLSSRDVQLADRPIWEDNTSLAISVQCCPTTEDCTVDSSSQTSQGMTVNECVTHEDREIGKHRGPRIKPVMLSSTFTQTSLRVLKESSNDHSETKFYLKNDDDQEVVDPGVCQSQEHSEQSEHYKSRSDVDSTNMCNASISSEMKIGKNLGACTSAILSSTTEVRDEVKAGPSQPDLSRVKSSEFLHNNKSQRVFEKGDDEESKEGGNDPGLKLEKKPAQIVSPKDMNKVIKEPNNETTLVVELNPTPMSTPVQEPTSPKSRRRRHSSGVEYNCKSRHGHHRHRSHKKHHDEGVSSPVSPSERIVWGQTLASTAAAAEKDKELIEFYSSETQKLRQKIDLLCTEVAVLRQSHNATICERDEFQALLELERTQRIPRREQTEQLTEIARLQAELHATRELGRAEKSFYENSLDTANKRIEVLEQRCIDLSDQLLGQSQASSMEAALHDLKHEMRDMFADATSTSILSSSWRNLPSRSTSPSTGRGRFASSEYATSAPSTPQSPRNTSGRQRHFSRTLARVSESANLRRSFSRWRSSNNG